MDRRAFLAAWPALFGALPAARASGEGVAVRLAAAWLAGSGHQVGVLALSDALRVAAAVDVPTRAHGLALEPAGTLLAVARRPGDWLLRWSPEGRPLAWHWIEPRRAFTGHILIDGDRIYTTETDLDTGAGLVGARHAGSLEKLAEWPTLGIDPHQLVRDARQPGAILVANGGVPTQPETGRLKRDMARMDASLVRLETATGAAQGQWRLTDPRLSIRHLAWNGATLGIALQAEHDDPEARAAAPVLALWEGHDPRAVAAPEALAGYGGDIAPLADGFAVACPRAQGVACFGPDGAWRGLLPLAEACPLAAESGRFWAGGRQQALGLSASRRMAPLPVEDLRLDNHWIALA